MPHISFKNVSFDFDGEQVLRKFSFEAKAGTHTVLKGESGSGKSTIFKLLLGFLIPSSGKIELKNVGQDDRSIRKQVAWLPQDLNLGDGKVSKVMAKPFEFAANKSQRPTDKQKTQMLQKLGLGKKIIDKQFRDLSTGQRQRVGLAICELLDKPLLLLDEPTSALDSASKKKAADLLLDSKQRTIISTSHDPAWVQLADNVIDID